MKKTCNNPKLVLAKMNAYIKFCEILPIGSHDNERTQNFGCIKGHNSGKNLRKMTCNKPKLDLAKMNTYIKCGEILPVGSQDIKRKQNFGVDKGS